MTHSKIRTPSIYDNFERFRVRARSDCKICCYSRIISMVKIDRHVMKGHILAMDNYSRVCEGRKASALIMERNMMNERKASGMQVNRTGLRVLFADLRLH